MNLNLKSYQFVQVLAARLFIFRKDKYHLKVKTTKSFNSNTYGFFISVLSSNIENIFFINIFNFYISELINILIFTSTLLIIFFFISVIQHLT